MPGTCKNQRHWDAATPVPLSTESALEMRAIMLFISSGSNQDERSQYRPGCGTGAAGHDEVGEVNAL